MRDHLIETGQVASTVIETVRRIRHERGISWQASKTVGTSDPDFTSDMRRVLDL